MFDLATYFAWFVIALLFFAMVWIIVALGSLPKKIALNRNHPQVDAINAASWIGLAMGGVGWFIAFVWALMRSGSVGYGGDSSPTQSPAASQTEVKRLRKQVAELERELQQHRTERS